MPTRYSKQNEIAQLQYEITNEISRDAKPIAQGVFGNNARHPDMATVSNVELDQMYRDAYARNDRTFLMQEAQRDPEQFLAVTDRIGVADPPQDMHGKPIMPQQQNDQLAESLAQQAAMNTFQSAPPQSTPAAPPVAAPPVALPPPAPTIAPAPMTPQGPAVQPPIVGGP